MNITSMNDTLDEPSSGYSEYSYIHFTVAAAVALCLCVAGLVGNVIVFWYLCFKIQRNKYTVYIINLAFADALFIICTMVILMVNINTMVGTDPDFIGKEKLYLSTEIFYDTMQYSGMYIFTALSMERCSSVLFPFWYQNYRPRNLSAIICTALWILGCFVSLLENLVCTTEAFMEQSVQCSAVQILVFVLAIGICLPVMVISSFILFFKVMRTFKQQYTNKLDIIIIILFLLFILSVVPFNFLWFLMFFRLILTDLITASLFFAAVFCTVFNCTVSPYIYIIVGKKWTRTCCYSIKEALQTAFREEENDDSKSIHQNKHNEPN